MRLALALAVVFAAAARDGLPPRSDAAQYAGKADAPGVTVAAIMMSPDQVRNEFSTTLVPRYQVLEVALYPKARVSVDVTTLDFGMRIDGRLVRPAEPGSIAARNQKKGRARSRDVALYPSVGVSTGSYGTGTNVGVGVGVGGSAPGPASTDRDRRVMETELEDRALQEVTADKPVAGYLYFPAGDIKSRSVELVYQYDGGEATIPLTLPQKE